RLRERGLLQLGRAQRLAGSRRGTLVRLRGLAVVPLVAAGTAAGGGEQGEGSGGGGDGGAANDGASQVRSSFSYDPRDPPRAARVRPARGFFAHLLDAADTQLIPHFPPGPRPCRRRDLQRANVFGHGVSGPGRT